MPGLEVQYKIGRYLDPHPEHRGAVARKLMAEYALDRTEEHPNYGYAPTMDVDFIRVQIGGLLHAFKSPACETVLERSDIGCVGVTEDGEALCKVWIFCPEDVQFPDRTHTIVLTGVALPLEALREGVSKRFEEILCT